MALKDILDTELHHVKITQDEVIALDSSAQNFYQQVMDSGDERETFVPPFKLFPTVLGTSSANNWVSTHVISIKTKACQHHLLLELFAHLFTNPTKTLAPLQYSLCSIATIIGHTEYQALLHEDNKFLASLATIPISGVMDSILDMEAKVPDPNNPDKTMPLHDAFLAQLWCLQVKQTQRPGKILLVTTKANLSIGCKWVDDNFKTLFNVHPPSSPNPNIQQ